MCSVLGAFCNICALNWIGNMEKRSEQKLVQDANMDTEERQVFIHTPA